MYGTGRARASCAHTQPQRRLIQHFRSHHLPPTATLATRMRWQPRPRTHPQVTDTQQAGKAEARERVG